MKMFKKTALLVLCAALVCSLLCGCGAANDMSYEMQSSLSESAKGDYGFSEEMYDSVEPGAASENDEFERKIIRNADLSLEAEDARE